MQGVQFDAESGESLSHHADVIAQALEPHVRVALLLPVQHERLFPQVPDFVAKSSLYPLDLAPETGLYPLELAPETRLYPFDLAAQAGLYPFDLAAQTGLYPFDLAAQTGLYPEDCCLQRIDRLESLDVHGEGLDPSIVDANALTTASC